MRPEGVLFAAAALAFVAVVALRRGRGAAPVLALAAGALLFIAPLAVRNAMLTGTVSLESKSAINFRLAQGLRAGTPYLAVADALDADARPVGPEIDPRFYSRAPQPQIALRERLGLAFAAEVRHLRDLAETAIGLDYGGGALAALALLGLFGTRWRAARKSDEIVLLGYVCTGYAALAGVWHFWPRYADIVLPVAIVWAARGVTHLRRWSALTRVPDAGLLALAVLLTASAALDVAHARSTRPPVEREAGAWIAAHSDGGLIVDVGTATAFYAGATWSPMPYADDRIAARYLRRIKPAYVVLDSSRAADYPPLHAWFANGLPSDIATRAFAATDGRGRTLVVYRRTAANTVARAR
jgi:hypothetical protein